MEHHLEGGKVPAFLREECNLDEKFRGTHLGGLAGGFFHLGGGQVQLELLALEPEKGVDPPFPGDLEDLPVLKPPFTVPPDPVVGQGDAAEAPTLELLDDHVLHGALPGLELVQVDHPLEDPPALLPEEDFFLEQRRFLPHDLELHEVLRRPVGEWDQGFVARKGPDAHQYGGEEDGTENAVEWDARRLESHEFAVRGQAAEGEQGRQEARHGKGHGHHLRETVDEEPRHHRKGDPLLDHEVRRLEEQIPRHEHHGEGRDAEKKGAGKLLQNVPVEKTEGSALSRHVTALRFRRG